MDETTLSASVYERLKKEIVTHRLRPGERVSESAVAAKCGTSKAPVRAALGRLQRERLVIQAGPKTQIVAPLTLREVQKVFDLRNLLEPEAIEMAAGRVNIAKLREINERCNRRIDLGDADQEYEILKANGDFHLEIASSCDNDILVDWLSQLHNLAGRIMWLALRTGDTALNWSQGHEELMDLLEKGDGAGARALQIHLLRQGQRQAYEKLAQLPGISDLNLKVPG